DAATEQARGLDDFGADDPAARALGQMRARMAMELDTARAEVDVFALVLAADVAEQAREHREMDLLVGRRGLVDAPQMFRDDRQQLRVDVAPLAHAADVDEVLPQQVFVLAVAELVLSVASSCVV